MVELTIPQGKKESAETWPSSVSHKHVMVPLHYPVDGRLKSLIVAIRDRRVILRGNEIQWLRAKRNYVTIQTSYEQFRVRETMMSIQKRIAPPLIRVHRSAIVNLDFIVEMRMKRGGEYGILMQDGTELL